MSLRLYTFLASLLLIVGFIALNTATSVGFGGARLDLTEARLFTLSDTSRQIARELSEPVDLTLVYSRRVGADYPDIRAHAARVRELLEAYRTRSRGMVRVHVVDPLPFSEDEDRALAAGLRAVETDGVDPLYFGLIGRNSIDEEEVIPFLSPEGDAALEYDITRLITRLDDPEPPRIGILSALNGLNGDPQGAESYRFTRQLAERYRIEVLSADFYRIPDDIDALVIVHPPVLTPYQIYLIDQFLLRRGRALIALDPQAQAARRVGLLQTEIVEASYLGPLLTHWGLDLPTDVLADNDAALPVNVPDGAGRFTVMPQPLFFAARGDALDQEDVRTSGLQRGINFGLAGWFEVADTAQDDWSVLARSTDNIGRVSASISSRTPDPIEVQQYLTPMNGPVPVALRRVQPLTTAFADGPVTPDVPDDPILATIIRSEVADMEHLASSSVSPRLVLLSDADLFDDGFYVNPQTGQEVADNGVFLLNVVDGIAGIEGLSALRARTPALRPMERVDALRRQAQERLLDEQRRVEEELQQTETRLWELETLRRETGDQVEDLSLLSEIDAFRAQVVDLRERLRGIERDFRRDIDQLADGLRLLNIWGGAALITLIGGLVLVMKRRRERQV